MKIEIIKNAANNPVAKFFCSSPETDAFFLKRGMWNDEILAFCRKLERERDEAKRDAEHWKIEYEIVADRLRGRKHPRDNGIIADDEIIPKLERERDELKEQLGQAMEIAEDFCGLVCYGMGWSGKDWSVENTRDARRTINWFQRLQEAVTK